MTNINMENTIENPDNTSQYNLKSARFIKVNKKKLEAFCKQFNVDLLKSRGENATEMGSSPI